MAIMFEVGQEIVTEFATLLGDPWHEKIVPIRERLHAKGLDAEVWANLTVLDVLGNAADFHMRLVRRFQEWPWMIFALIRKDPGEDCPVRRAVAAQVMLVESIADPFVRSLKGTFGDELRKAELDGCLDDELFDMLSVLAGNFLIDSDEIEGMNGVIKHMAKTSPNIQIKLMSSRLMIKQTLTPRKLSLDERRAIVSYAANNHHVINDVPEPRGRFAICDNPHRVGLPALADAADAADGDGADLPIPGPIPIDDGDGAGGIGRGDVSDRGGRAH